MPLCRVCKNKVASTQLGLCDNCEKRIFSYSSQATIQGVSKLLGLSSETLKRLEKTGQLVPTRNDYGSRLYSKEAVRQYLKTRKPLSMDGVIAVSGSKKAQPAHEPSKIHVKDYVGIETDELLSINDEFILDSKCVVCETNEQTKGRYCDTCFDDLISLGTAKEIYGITAHQLQSLIENPENELRYYKYGEQRRVSHTRLDTFFARHGNVKNALKAKWSSHHKVCRTCKTNTHPYYGSGFCSECWPLSSQSIAFNKYKSGQTLQQVGDDMGITRERVRQIIAKAQKDIMEYQQPDEPFRSIMRKRGIQAVALENIVVDPNLDKAMGLHGKQCYSCQEPYNKIRKNLSVYYADDNPDNNDEHNIYPICQNCINLMKV